MLGQRAFLKPHLESWGFRAMGRQSCPNEIKQEWCVQTPGGAWGLLCRVLAAFLRAACLFPHTVRAVGATTEPLLPLDSPSFSGLHRGENPPRNPIDLKHRLKL